MRDRSWRVGLTVVILGALLIGGLAEVSAETFVGLPPCRVVDTRGNGFSGAFGQPALASGVPRDFPIQGQCGIPANAVGVSLNVTATNTQGAGFFSFYPQGSPQPLVSTLNYLGGETVAPPSCRSGPAASPSSRACPGRTSSST